MTPKRENTQPTLAQQRQQLLQMLTGSESKLFIADLNACFRMAALGDRRDDLDSKDKCHLESLSLIIEWMEKLQ